MLLYSGITETQSKPKLYYTVGKPIEIASSRGKLEKLLMPRKFHSDLNFKKTIPPETIIQSFPDAAEEIRLFDIKKCAIIYARSLRIHEINGSPTLWQPGIFEVSCATMFYHSSKTTLSEANFLEQSTCTLHYFTVKASEVIPRKGTIYLEIEKNSVNYSWVDFSALDDKAIARACIGRSL